jgi:hypothetical protein
MAQLLVNHMQGLLYLFTDVLKQPSHSVTPFDRAPLNHKHKNHYVSETGMLPSSGQKTYSVGSFVRATLSHGVAKKIRVFSKLCAKKN